ncbi:MAG: chromosome segregation protein SMC [Gammaproteobacteria bacterium]|nr:chromosome segregation protein SMC [Gammaproteobacteria bacterium]MCP5298987.1 chromosome segregation protein SMC [Chromatiaceae bacterium]
MRLEKIKLAGFKSFVDPTTVSFPSNLVGVVGPNGCGKSNIIDAVRWVMGESSAKNLRGESMADVIFNGSSSRKPVGTASIELVFDNADGSAGGQYAQYGQISVKRQVSRDGQSIYHLNGVRCRRRDITDLFLGTGLGPRSYSIIEQGMISRIIEARPEDLRIYLEEAAGISKYKERRRETENRIAHTRENLERLDDLREEVQKQLRHLERQAATAEKYKTFRDEERRVRAELLVLRLADMLADTEQRDRAIAEKENRLQAAIADQRRIEARIEEQRTAHAEANDGFNEVQGRFYAVGAEIARLEEAIQYAREARRQHEADLVQARASLQQALSLSEQDSSRLAEVAGELERDQPMLDAARANADTAAHALNEAEAAMHAWQTEWDGFNQSANEPAQRAQVERTRINHLEQQESQLKRRLERNAEEQRHLSDISLQAEISELQRRDAEGEAALQLVRDRVGARVQSIRELRDRNQHAQEELAAARTEVQTLKGRLSSLQALQQAARGEGDKAVERWLGEHGLAEARRLLVDLEVSPEWQKAVEIVLAEQLQAVAVDRLEGAAHGLDTIARGSLTLFESSTAAAPARPGTLAAFVSGAGVFGQVLNTLHIARDIDDALARRTTLAAGECLVTPDGVRVGPGWVSVQRGADAREGVLARENEIRDLTRRLAEIEPRVEQVAAQLAADRQALVDAEHAREVEQRELEAAQRMVGELRALLSGKQARAEQIRHRLEGLEKDAQDISQQIEQGSAAMDTARRDLHAALASIEDLGKQREQLVARRDVLREVLDKARAAASDARNHVHEIALRVETMRTSKDSLRSGIDRMQQQLEHLQSRCNDLEQGLEAGKGPIGEQQLRLEQHLQTRAEVETRLTGARKSLEAIDHELRELDRSRHQVEQRVQDERTHLDQARMARQEIVVRSNTLEEQLAETGFDRDQLVAEMPEEAAIAAWQQRVEDLATRIQRLGPINLAAIDEFKEQSERMAYLDSQHADVSKSLETLEEAIRKIDRETRTRFKETFDRVDTGFKELFPKLFGGGHAYLELTGEDLLDTGVTVMARPPGKRNSSIHLLSGGEKALTAVALVFAIFRLNPAPFCMLDEVDAPLDDANVGRYSAMVKEMSEHVQFIFITHNKVTMEIANQLSGVTMHEPGVSRLVAVDVEEAAALAAV